MYWVIQAAHFLAEKNCVEVLQEAVQMRARAAVIEIVGADCVAGFVRSCPADDPLGVGSGCNGGGTVVGRRGRENILFLLV